MQQALHKKKKKMQHTKKCPYVIHKRNLSLGHKAPSIPYFKQPLLPVVQLGPHAPLVLQLHALQNGAIKVSPGLSLGEKHTGQKGEGGMQQLRRLAWHEHRGTEYLMLHLATNCLGQQGLG